MSRTRVAVATLIVLGTTGLAGCAVNPPPVSTAGRPDITAAPPKSMAAGGAAKAKAGKAAPAKERAAAKRDAPSKVTPKQAPAAEEPAVQETSWVRLTDEPTGVRFSLPQTVQPVTTRDGNGTSRAYNVGDPTAVGRMTSVTVTEMVRETNLAETRAFLAEFRRQLAATVGMQPEVVDKVAEEADGRPVVAETLVFRPGNGAVSVARVRAVAAGRVGVFLAVVVNGTDEAAVRNESGDRMGRILSDFRLP